MGPNAFSKVFPEVNRLLCSREVFQHIELGRYNDTV